MYNLHLYFIGLQVAYRILLPALGPLAFNLMVLHTAMREPLLHIIVTNILYTPSCLVEHITNGTHTSSI